MTVRYASISPYNNTPQESVYVEYLGIWPGVNIVPRSTDDLYEISTKYVNNPALLSFDLYGSPRWWFVFMVRNPDIIKDPIYDMKAGTVIYLPSKDTLPRMGS